VAFLSKMFQDSTGAFSSLLVISPVNNSSIDSFQFVVSFHNRILKEKISHFSSSFDYHLIFSLFEGSSWGSFPSYYWWTAWMSNLLFFSFYRSKQMTDLGAFFWKTWPRLKIQPVICNQCSVSYWIALSAPQTSSLTAVHHSHPRCPSPLQPCLASKRKHRSCLKHSSFLGPTCGTHST
jgi:hypothetical protein